jgi:nitroreductase
MTFLELVRKRRSVRAYEPARVSRDVLERCLEAARLAPSACNSQPWRFIVVDDPTLKAEVAGAAFTGMYSMNTFAADAPVLIAVVRERSKFAAALGGLFRGVHYALIDVGIACEHLVLQAEEEGLGTCWLGWFNEKAVKRILRLGAKDKVDIMISVGYPAPEDRRDGQRKPLGEITRFNVEQRGGSQS